MTPPSTAPSNRNHRFLGGEEQAGRSLLLTLRPQDCRAQTFNRPSDPPSVPMCRLNRMPRGQQEDERRADALCGRGDGPAAGERAISTIGSDLS